MPEALAGAWATPGLGWLVLIIFVAGMVRGFAGFGTALIFVPLAALIIPPVWVLIALVIVDLIGPLPLIPRAARDGDPAGVGMLLLGCALLLPFGTMLLQAADPETFRWTISVIVLAMVAVLASGWRHDWRMARPARVGIGALSGFMGGFTGLPGPPVILTYMSGRFPPSQIRADIILYLLAFDVMLALTFLVRGMFEMTALWVGLILSLPYLLGNLIGARAFDPKHARLYRWVAYVIIAGSALLSLPLFG